MKHKKTKARYHLRNWREYNRALVQRGRLTLGFSAEVLTVWQSRERTGQRGHPWPYSDTAILTMATLQAIYHLGVRQTEGLVDSLGELLHLEVAIPHYSTLSRRRATLEIELPRTRSKEALHVVVDSTGVKVFGEGEWKVRQHGYTYRRTWRKVHLGVDEASGEIVAAVVTTNNYSDSQLLPDLLEQVLASHSLVEGTSELPYLSRVASWLNRNRVDGINYPEAVRELGPGNFQSRGKLLGILSMKRGVPMRRCTLANPR